MNLRLDWASNRVARKACERWHYSHSIPVPPYNVVGAWEDENFVGVVIFSRGASPDLCKPYGLTQFQVCELSRVALSKHQSATSRIVAIAMRFLRQRSPGLRLVISFADQNQNHHGGIYQAMNWIYTGETTPASRYVDPSGRIWHSRQVSTSGVTRQFGAARLTPKRSDCTKLEELPKHRYLMPLDAAIRERVAPLAKPYPKRRVGPTGGAPAPTGDGGSIPTSTLHTSCPPSC